MQTKKKDRNEGEGKLGGKHCILELMKVMKSILSMPTNENVIDIKI